jgi:uncharacterized phage infection (PIP) family protein YhgE
MENEKFQEIVLQQLKALAEGQKSLEDNFQSLADGHKSLEDNFQSLANGHKSLEDNFQSLADGHKSLEDNFQSLADGHKSLEDNFQSLADGQRQLIERLTRVENVVRHIENDHGTKLGILLDGYHHNAEVLANHTERLDRIESKITTHDIQISILDKTKSNKRKAK